MATTTPATTSRPITLLPISLEDSDALARNNIGAFWQDLSWECHWPEERRKPEIIIREVALRAPNRLVSDRHKYRFQKAVFADDPSPEGQKKLVGYARWILPTGFSRLDVWTEALSIPEVTDPAELARYKELAESLPYNSRTEMDYLDEPVAMIKRQILGEKDYMILDYLAVHPDNARQGIATELVKSGMRKADELGVPMFILAFKMAQNLYRKLGFRVVAECHQDDSKFGGSGYNIWYFVREPEKLETNKKVSE